MSINGSQKYLGDVPGVVVDVVVVVVVVVVPGDGVGTQWTMEG